MENIKNVILNIKAEIFGGVKIPHGISNPVLRMDNNKLYIAFFAYTYNKEQLKNKKIPRPIHWILADAETGIKYKEYDCKINDFSTANFDELYDLNNTDVPKYGREKYEELYNILDEVRSKYISEKVIIDKYNQYFDTILCVTPDSYRRFYKELSNV